MKKIFDTSKLLLQKGTIKNTKVQYVIGIDAYNEGNKAYCLMRKVNDTSDIILMKWEKDSPDMNFNEEVQNLAKYFNALLIIEK